MPIASCALIGFIVAAVQAILHLRTGEPKWDVRAYVSIHISVIFGIAALLTGAIWAKASWGEWWVWDEPTLVSFLIVFLLYCTYYPLRYAIEDRERQARYASVFAIIAGAFVPLNFIAVRLAETLIHPRVFATSEGGLPPKMMFTFLVCFAGMALLWETLVRLRARGEVVAGADRPPAPGARGRRGGDGELADRPGPAEAAGLMPALPLDEAGKYVAGAYVVFLALLLIYVAIMAARLARIDRELAELAELAEKRLDGSLMARRREHEKRREASPSAMCSERSNHQEVFPVAELLGARRLAQDRAAGAARADGADRGPRRRHPRRAASSAPRCSRRRRSRPATAPSSTSMPPTRWAPRPAPSACSRARPRPSRPSSSATSTRSAAPPPPSS